MERSQSPKMQGQSHQQEKSVGDGRLLRVLQVHNYYQLSGGEDQVFEAEGELLRTRGHDVLQYTVSNDAVDGMSMPVLASKTVWSKRASDEIAELVRKNHVDVVHFHNTLPLVSPAAYWSARKAGAAVVQTLHNYRLICPGSLLSRDGAPCEKCVGKSFAAASIKHKCYRGSRAATAAVASMTTTHRALGTWNKAVDRYIAITEFAKGKFVDGGLPEDKISVKPNFLTRYPEVGNGSGGFALFVGRLDEAKGVRVLLEAWQSDLKAQMPKLIVVGDGDISGEVAAATSSGSIDWLGWKSNEEVLGLMQQAGVLLFPSQVFEGGTPMSLVEAFASGLPVIASDIGTMRTMIADGQNGMLVDRESARAFADATIQILNDSTQNSAMRAAARKTFETTYGPNRNYRILTSIYDEAVAERRKGGENG